MSSCSVILNMALLARGGILSYKWLPRLESVRFRRVNVQRPRAPHYERAKFLALMEPLYKEDESIFLPPSMKCKKSEELKVSKTRPDNPLERIIAKELYDTVEKSNMVCIVHTNPILGEDEFQARLRLKREQMKIERHSKYTLERAFRNTRYEAILSLFVTHSAIIFSNEPKVDKLLKILKKTPEYVLMAGIIDNTLLSAPQIIKYAELKDLTNARAQLLGTLNACAQQTVSQLMAHPHRLLAQLQHLASSESDKS